LDLSNTQPVKIGYGAQSVSVAAALISAWR
jgi:hypothetical protein